jgi:hypothetical protein
MMLSTVCVFESLHALEVALAVREARRAPCSAAQDLSAPTKLVCIAFRPGRRIHWQGHRSGLALADLQALHEGREGSLLALRIRSRGGHAAV